MTHSQLSSLLKEFEPFFGCRLEPGSLNSCLIRFGIGMTLQIEMSRSGMLLLACRLGATSGKYRESLMKQALKTNELSPLSSGIFGFSYKSGQLILYATLDPKDINQHSLSLFLPPFLAKAKEWKACIDRNELPSLPEDSSSQAPSGLFGLMT